MGKERNPEREEGLGRTRYFPTIFLRCCNAFRKEGKTSEVELKRVRVRKGRKYALKERRGLSVEGRIWPDPIEE